MSVIVKNLTPDSAKRVIQALGKRETLNLVLQVHQHNGSHLSELEKRFNGRLSRKIIHERLKELKTLGILRSTNTILNSKRVKNCAKIRVLRYYLSPEYSELFEFLSSK